MRHLIIMTLFAVSAPLAGATRDTVADAAPSPWAEPATIAEVAAERADSREPRDNAARDALASVLEGLWVNVQPDQRIELLLGAAGLSRWTVTFEGEPWSDLAGSWRASDGRLILDNHMGRVEFSVELTREGHLVLTDTAPFDTIAELRFARAAGGG